MGVIGTTGRRVNRALVGDTDSLASEMRRRRWQRLLETFPDLDEMRVLDLGGETRFWTSIPTHPAQVTMVNPTRQPAPAADWLSFAVGDACALPDDLHDFDLVFSNSVIEHVGGHWRRQRFAAEVRRSAPRYWVQTPYRYFPLEAHFLFPFFAQLPLSARARIASRWPLMSIHSEEKALRYAMGIELLTFPEMGYYFPDAEIEVERALGLTKSMIAVRR